ncbi:MAG: dihydrodipicolinate synthase family protein [Acidobacteria bacterium]|nr:dihydrodipicolinate synthase family protein [Acidobacteriota bacterium]MBI3280547.1 dihydrodipicolinate synthase family protein [Acidobacteriota bacterium]
MRDLHGIIPAVVTPFDAEEQFKPQVFETLLERVYSAGAHGVYVCGQTGEGLLQPVEQRKRVAEAAVSNSPAGRQIIIHTGAYRTADAVELTRHASRIGATAVSSLPPLGAYSFAEIRAYYEALAAAAEVPLLIYYFPEVCPGIASAEQILELTSIPNIVGLKFTDFDLYRLESIKNSGAVLFNGRDEVLVAGLLMGADGGIGTFYNLVPELFVEVYRLAGANEWRRARAVQARINELIRLTLRFPLFPAVKRMLGWSGIDCGACLAPRRRLSAGEEERLREALAVSSFAESGFPGLAVR